MLQPNRQPEGNKFLKYFTLIMSLLYPVLGLYLFFSSEEQIHLDSTIKKVLGAVLVIYGVVRFIRAYQQHFKSRDRFRDEE